MLIARLLPAALRQRLQPFWYKLRLIVDYQRAPNQRIRFNRETLSFIAVRPIGTKSVPLVVRSYRELRRWHNLGRIGKADDLILQCLETPGNIEVFYDIGASNGIYGFAARALHGCKVVFIEPYTPSVETILKTIYVTVRMGAPRDSFEMVPAAIDAADSFARLDMHGPPIAGETRNTYADAAVYTGEDRGNFPVAVSQWTKGVSLDALVYEHGLPAPTVAKIDVDGYETNAIAGASRLLQDRQTELFIVEMNDEAARRTIDAEMVANGYRYLTHKKHHPDTDLFVGDWLYVREDAQSRWSALAHT